VAQAWFRERYGNVYTLIVNNFAEPSETPAHNALQALFLNKDLCRNLLNALNWLPLANPLEYARNIIRDRGWTVGDIHYDLATLQEDIERGRKLEAKGVRGEKRAWLELKTALGDDYPAALRQMKANSQKHRP
jgi:hypothetical protein